jgi:hypothetical protein
MYLKLKAALAWLVASGLRIDSLFFRFRKLVKQYFPAVFLHTQVGGTGIPLKTA